MEKEKAICYFNEFAKQTRKVMLASRVDQSFLHIPGTGGRGITFRLQPDESTYKPYCRICDATLCDLKQQPVENVYGITEFKRCNRCNTTYGLRYV